MENENISDIKKIVADAFNCTTDIANVSTATGEPIITPNGTTIIPISKVAVGFATGGVDLSDKQKDKGQQSEQGGSDDQAKAKKPKKAGRFGGGGGTGVTVTPVGFLIISPNGKIDLLNVNSNTETTNMVDSISGLLDRSPDIIARLKSVITGKETEEKTEEEK